MSIKMMKPDPNSPYKNGYFRVKNPEKYLGNKNAIIYRSGLEFKFCKLCDTSHRIIKWSSEPFHIKYYNPVKMRDAKYYPDYYVETNEGNGKIKKWIIEVKAGKFIKRPKKPSKYASRKQIKRYNDTLRRFAVNMAKYKAAKKYAKRINAEYIFLTESFFRKK